MHRRGAGPDRERVVVPSAMTWACLAMARDRGPAEASAQAVVQAARDPPGVGHGAVSAVVPVAEVAPVAEAGPVAAPRPGIQVGVPSDPV